MACPGCSQHNYVEFLTSTKSEKILSITSSDTILAQGIGFKANNKYQGLKFVAGKYLVSLGFTV